MGIKVNEKKIGSEHNLACSKCTGRTAHSVLSSVDLTESDDYAHYLTEYQIVQCGGCKEISFRRASSNSEDIIRVGEDEWEHEVIETLYPSRLEGQKGLGDDVHLLPGSVRRIYEETHQALLNQSPVLAGIGLRALLETVCKEKNAAGSDLFHKIDALVTSQVLTPASAAILHKIRTLGNAAAHEVKPHTEKQLSLGLYVIEHLLRDVYILPKQVDEEFK